MSELEEAVVAALQESIDEDGSVDFYTAAPMVISAIRVIATITVTPVSYRSENMPQDMRMSLTVVDPYLYVTPEWRAHFPLTEAMVEQNRRLLEATLDSLVSENMRLPVGKRKKAGRHRRGDAA